MMRHHALYDKKGVIDKYLLLIIIRNKPPMWKSYIRTSYLYLSFNNFHLV